MWTRVSAGHPLTSRAFIRRQASRNLGVAGACGTLAGIGSAQPGCNSVNQGGTRCICRCYSRSPEESGESLRVWQRVHSDLASRTGGFFRDECTYRPVYTTEHTAYGRSPATST
ncbi:hypothetical protein LZ32DRAFT_601904 [Colletotrichum eremochloae]|nr:hypothetical protein LZ32DRAFT_601904 [Colletotrichum eremochloae]